MRFGTVLRRIRESRTMEDGSVMTKSELARRAGLSHPNISRWENGDRVYPLLSSINALSDALDANEQERHDLMVSGRFGKRARQIQREWNESYPEDGIMKLDEGYVVVQVDKDMRQYRDTNNAIVWLNQLDRKSGLSRPRSIKIHFPEGLGGGWCSGTPRFAIETIRKRVDKAGGIS